jgi:hypothetical protein
MRFFILSLLLGLFLPFTTSGQRTNVNGSLGLNATKEWKITKKFEVEIRQSLQGNLERRDQDKKNGDIFNELDFLPIEQDTEQDSDGDGVTNRDDDDDDNDGVNDNTDDDDEDDETGDETDDDDEVTGDGDDDDSSDDGDGNGGDGDGNDDDDDDDDDDDGGLNSVDDRDGGTPNADGSLPNDWFMEWRGATSIRSEWRVLRWLRVANNYGVFYGGNTFRHRLSTELRFIPDIDVNNLELSGRLGVQHVAAQDDNEWEWNHALLPRIDAEYKLSKIFRVYVSAALNGALEDKTVDFDRYRLDGGLQLRLSKHHDLDLGYRFQQRIGGKRTIAHNLGVTYGYRF